MPPQNNPMEFVPYLYGILLSLIIVNLIIYGLAWITQNSRTSKTFGLYWVIQFVTFLIMPVMPDAHLAQAFPFGTSIFAAHLLYRAFFQQISKVPNFTIFYVLFAFGWGVAITNEVLFNDFFLTTYPIALALTIPGFYGLYLISSSKYPQFKTLHHRVLLVIAFLAVAHTFNFPLFGDDKSTVLWGMGGHIVIMTALSLNMTMFHTFRAQESEKARLEAMVRQQTAKLSKRCEELQELSEEKAALFRIVLHDISNPMSAVMGYIDYAQKDNIPADKKTFYLKEAEKSATTIASTIRQVRSMEAISENKTAFYMEDLDLHDVFSTVETIFRPQYAAKSVSLKINYPTEHLTLKGNRELFIQSVLGNLLSNSLKFSEPGSGVELSCEKKEDKLKIFVTDQGTGIEANSIPALFDIKTSSSKPGTQGEKGTGFGMPLLKRYMDSVNGKISIRTNQSPAVGHKRGTNVELMFNA